MKRRLLKLGVFLLLLAGGVIINVAVAWGCLWMDVHRQQPICSQLDSNQCNALHRRFSQCGLTPAMDDPTVRFVVRGEASTGGRAVIERMLRDHVVMQSKTGQSAGAQFFTEAERQMCGWPMQSLGGERWLQVSGPERNNLKLQKDLPKYSPAVQQRIAPLLRPISATWQFHDSFALPSTMLGLSIPGDGWFVHRPIWPGFAINTLFYAAIPALLFYAPGKIRRFIRIRGHRCPACGHIIAAGTCANGLCSECASPLPKGFKPKPEASAQT